MVTHLKQKRDPMAVRPLLKSTKPPYCYKCGKRGELHCTACATKYREWMHRNCDENGGMTPLKDDPW